MSGDATPRLSLSYIVAAQAKSPVTMNQALALLDGLMQARLEGRTQASRHHLDTVWGRVIALLGAFASVLLRVVGVSAMSKQAATLKTATQRATGAARLPPFWAARRRPRRSAVTPRAHRRLD